MANMELNDEVYRHIKTKIDSKGITPTSLLETVIMVRREVQKLCCSASIGQTEALTLNFVDLLICETSEEIFIGATRKMLALMGSKMFHTEVETSRCVLL